MMKMTNQFGLLIIFLTILMQGCLVEDPLQIPEPEAYFEENFDDLNIEVIQSVETPFQSVFQSSTRVSSGNIRIFADEISYNLHIILRFEMELALFEKRITVKDVPTD